MDENPCKKYVGSEEKILRPDVCTVPGGTALLRCRRQLWAESQHLRRSASSPEFPPGQD